MDGHTENASLREVMRSYPTGVTIVTACDTEGVPYGLTVNSFTSVSLEPPLVLVCIECRSASHDRLVSASHFTVNLLSADQGPLAYRFARPPSEGRFDDVEWSRSASGGTVIEGTVGWLHCAVHEVLTGGDHSILLGRVEHSATHDRPALIFHRGRMQWADG